jgi:LmbE family N-acetylglucosaminyl deacetylase
MEFHQSEFHQSGAEVFVPDGASVEKAFSRTTHLAVAAHQDDLEIMAYRGILECFGRDDMGFLGVTVTDGSGSPRDGIYAKHTDPQMQRVRRAEQKKAAVVGEFSAVALLDFPSAAVKGAARKEVVADIRRILEAARPEILYTHNLADKHDTHVAVALRTIEAARLIPEETRPRAVYGCEVWRDLDWMVDRDKVSFDVGAHENLAAALVGVFDSQIAGGKRYDLATWGRRRAHATYHQSHGTDETLGLTFAMDLSPLVRDPSLDVAEYVLAHVRRFHDDVAAKLEKFR